GLGPRARRRVDIKSPPVARRAYAREEPRMPFVNVRLYEGHGKERKDELAKRITQAVTDGCKGPPQAGGVVFEEVPPSDWFAAGAPGRPVKKGPPTSRKTERSS